MQEVSHLSTLSMNTIADENWLGGVYPLVDNFLLDYPLLNTNTRLFHPLSNVYLVFHNFKYFTEMYIFILINILENDSAGVLVVSLSPTCFSNLLEKIYCIDSKTLIANRIHNIPFNSISESIRLISQSTIVLDISQNNYDSYNISFFIHSIHHGIPFISLNANIQTLIKRLNISPLIIKDIDDYKNLIHMIITNLDYRQKITKNMIDSKEYLFESNKQSDILYTFLKKEINKPTGGYSEIENLLFN